MLAVQAPHHILKKPLSIIPPSHDVQQACAVKIRPQSAQFIRIDGPRLFQQLKGLLKIAT